MQHCDGCLCRCRPESRNRRLSVYDEMSASNMCELALMQIFIGMGKPRRRRASEPLPQRGDEARGYLGFYYGESMVLCSFRNVHLRELGRPWRSLAFDDRHRCEGY